MPGEGYQRVECVRAASRGLREDDRGFSGSDQSRQLLDLIRRLIRRRRGDRHRAARMDQESSSTSTGMFR
jgi:hypothetical protein